MSERKRIRLYGQIIDKLRGYSAMQLPLLTEEQALLTRAIKSLYTCNSLQAQLYIRKAESLLINA